MHFHAFPCHFHAFFIIFHAFFITSRPNLACLLWHEAKLAASELGCLSGSLRRLEELQLRVLRSWGEAARISWRFLAFSRLFDGILVHFDGLSLPFRQVSYVEQLLQCVRCEVCFGPESSEHFRRFVGFRSGALQALQVEHTERVSCTGRQLVALALRCLQALLALFVGPAGCAKHLQGFQQHVLELVSQRERGAPGVRPCQAGREVGVAGVAAR